MTSTDNHHYEMVYIARPDFGEDGINGLNERLVQTIKTQGGELQVTENWGKRNLAYRIARHSEGHYVLHRYAMPGKGAGELERILRLNENVIRYLVVRTDE